MRTFSSWRLTRSTSLLRTIILLCLSVFLLSWSAGGSGVSATLAGAGAPFAEQPANGEGYPIEDYYLARVAAEGEAREKLPKNAALLKTLVVVLFFGLTLRWLLLTSGWMRCRQEVCSPVRCCFHSIVHLHQRRAVATLLGVSRL
jgi:hypothetical protein